MSARPDCICGNPAAPRRSKTTGNTYWSCPNFKNACDNAYETLNDGSFTPPTEEQIKAASNKKQQLQNKEPTKKQKTTTNGGGEETSIETIQKAIFELLESNKKIFDSLDKILLSVSNSQIDD